MMVADRSVGRSVQRRLVSRNIVLRGPIVVKASNDNWQKWLPSNPTDVHWYSVEDFERLIAANICHDPQTTIREFITEFRGLSGTTKQKRVLEKVKLSRARLADLVVGNVIDKNICNSMLTNSFSATKNIHANFSDSCASTHRRLGANSAITRR
jgi:hypothetical protein